MKTRACVLHAQQDVRIETLDVGDVGPEQVLVRMGAGGVCGSDIHYFWDGGIGTIRVSEPIVLGHEVAGTVQAVGAAVQGIKPGDKVALNPSRACGRCRYCREGQQHHCMHMQFFGSAMFTPHSQGGFRDLMIVDPAQCVPMGKEVSLAEAACAEPLSVAVHAVNQAGSLLGRRVLVTGVGPIGALVVATAKYAGAAEIVATDLSEAPLKATAAMGASTVINGSQEPQRLMADYAAEKGAFDVVFECSGAAAVLKQVFALTRPRGKIVQVGVMGETPIPMNALVGKEINLVGTHRANTEFATAARLIRERRIDVRPIISATLPMERIDEAFSMARDRASHMKVQLSFA